MMEWAGAIFHAIALANGGGYISEYEGDRVQAFGGVSGEASSASKVVETTSRANPVVELDENLAQRLSEVHMSDGRGAFQNTTEEALEDFAEEIFVSYQYSIFNQQKIVNSNSNYVYRFQMQGYEGKHRHCGKITHMFSTRNSKQMKKTFAAYSENALHASARIPSRMHVVSVGTPI